MERAGVVVRGFSIWVGFPAAVEEVAGGGDWVVEGLGFGWRRGEEREEGGVEEDKEACRDEEEFEERWCEFGSHCWLMFHCYAGVREICSSGSGGTSGLADTRSRVVGNIAEQRISSERCFFLFFSFFLVIFEECVHSPESHISPSRCSNLCLH